MTTGHASTVGYLGFRDDKTGVVRICYACVDENKGKDWGGHSFAPVYVNDHLVTVKGGFWCDACKQMFI
jgi:hypothetical protein